MTVAFSRRALGPYLVLGSGIAAAYWATGKLALFLAIPPGYATAVWPPAGIAFAAVVVYGARVWPGIVLGSMLVNLWTAFESTTVGTLLQSLALPTSIGMGAALQAMIGAVLVRRTVGFPIALDRERDIAVVLTLGGPVSCLVGATWGVGSLLVTGVIPWGHGLLHWWTWWVGDTIGVLVVLPLLLVWTAAPRQSGRRHRLAVAIPLGITLGLVLLFFVYARAAEQARITRDFERQASTLAATFRERLEGYLDVLYAIERFYASARGVSRHEFHTFVQRFFTRHPGIQALSWDRRVPDAERSAYEEGMRREGGPAFQITEQHPPGRLGRAAQRPEYVVVSYIEPLAGNEEAFGYDVASEATRLAALSAARDMGAPRATGRLLLVQEPDRQFGLLIVLPLYDTGLPPDTVAARRQHLSGYATGVFRIGDLVEAALRPFARAGLGLQLEDETAPVGERLLYSQYWRPLGDPERAGAEADGTNTAGLRWHTTVEIAGRRWTLRVAPTLAYLTAQRPWYTWSLLACGLLFVGLMGAFLLALTGRTMRTEQLVVERTTANALLAREVAERRRAAEAQAQLAAIVASSDDAIISKTLDGRIRTWNAGAERMYGYTRAEVEGRSIALLLPPDRADELPRLLERLKRGERIESYETVRRHKAGHLLTVSLTISPLRDATGTVVGASAIARDITERTRLEAQLRQAQKMEALGTLAGGIAHDFNNILTAILGYTELALYKIPAEHPARPHVEAVQGAGRRAVGLVQQILTFSRRTEQARTPTQLQRLIAETLALLRATLPTTIALQQDLDDRAGPVLAEPTQMQQVLLNLCTNAAHAMRETGGVLAVRLETLRLPTEGASPPGLGAGPYVRLTVRDTGQGMPPEIRDRIFEPFFTTKRVGEGTGLGLAVVHGIIASHGGALTVDSAPGQGTTMAVYLPQSTQQPAAPGGAEAPVPRGHECLLFVDDEAALVRLGHALLTALGYTVVAVTSSVEALALFQATPERFALVITDYTMPELTGEALARALRRLRPDLPIILCTGYSETMTAEKAEALDIDAFCLKPFVIHDLGRTIRHVLRQRMVKTVR